MNNETAPTSISIWISTAEIARRTGKSNGAIQGLLHAGILPGVQRGSRPDKKHGRWYVRRADFDKWLAGEQPQPTIDEDGFAERVAIKVAALLATSTITVQITPAAPAELREVRRAKGR